VTYAYLASKEASLRLSFTRGDVIVAIAAAPYVFALRTSRPLVYVSDATFACIRSIYSVFADMPHWLSGDADKVERGALHKSNHVIFSSEWAKSSAILDYGVEPDAISVMPLGPNIRGDVIDRFQPAKSVDFRRGVRLLFIGADWDRKGGPTVLDIKRELDSHEIPCEVFLVGNCPNDLPIQHDIHVLGRLDKSDEGQLLELCGLYESAHFFVLPTSAEAYGIVFSEAQAFGCPSLTYAVGGTPTAVLDGITGFTLPLGAVAKDFAEKICSLVREPRQYERMSANCRSRYETEANWDIWAKSIINIADRLREETRDSSVSQNG
jgi:glycosyltransferase involved in cell wall biosynthesis